MFCVVNVWSQASPDPPLLTGMFQNAGFGLQNPPVAVFCRILVGAGRYTD